MRIVVVSNYYPPFEVGGWEQLTRDVVEQLRIRGHEIRVLTSRHRVRELQHEEEVVLRKLHLQSPDRFHYHPRYSFEAPWRERENKKTVAWLLNSFSPDVVFVNGMWNLSPTVAHTFEKACPGRVVYYMASYWPEEPDAHLSYWRDPATNPWLRVPKRVLGSVARSFVPCLAAKKDQLHFSRILCVSEFIRNFVICQVGIPSKNAHVVYNGIDLDQFRSFRNSAQLGRPTSVLYAGGLIELKGVMTAVEAIGHLVKELKVLDVHLTIAGQGSPDYVRRLKKRVCELQIESFVSFKKWIPRDQMPGLLRKHDILVFPSIWSEPLARMVQEAMACGLVVVASKTGGTPEIITHEQNGLNFKAEDGLELAFQLARLFNQPGLWQRLSQAGRETIKQRFTLDRMVGQVETHLSQVAASRQRFETR